MRKMTTEHLKRCERIAREHGTREGEELASAILAALAAVVMLAAVMAPVNVYDTLPIKCGHRLRDTCPPSGINWP